MTKKNSLTHSRKSIKSIFIIFLWMMLGVFHQFSHAQTESQLQTLQSNLDKQEYYVFNDNLEQFFTDENQRIDYLMKQTPSGHPIIYWLLAHYYSRNIVAFKFKYEDKAQIEFTKYMTYIAVIMLEQDITTCMDNYAKNGSRLIMQRYPTILDFERRNPYGNKEVFAKAVDFISKLKKRQNPSWICKIYGDPENTGVYGQTSPASEYNNIRKSVIQRMIKNMG